MIVLLVSFAILATVSGEPFPNRIRSDIADCYQQFDRFQRFPQSTDNLVALIRKVEAHPDTQFWDLKRMTGVLLHRFRYDGIIDDLKAGPNLPIHTDHSESDKFKLQWQFLPGESTDFPESSLTQAEKCSIHWMLSHSINMTMRAEELVSRLKPTVRNVPGVATLAAPVPSAGPSSVIIKTLTSPKPPAQTTTTKKPAAVQAITPVVIPVHHVSYHDIVEPRSPMVLKGSRLGPLVQEEETEGEEEEEEEEEEEKKVEKKVVEETEEETVEETEEETEEDDSDVGKSSYSSNSFWFRKRRELEEQNSLRPLELGVVSTSSGTIAPGVVLAGILAGLDRQSFPLNQIVKDPSLSIGDSA